MLTILDRFTLDVLVSPVGHAYTFVSSCTQALDAICQCLLL